MSELKDMGGEMFKDSLNASGVWSYRDLIVLAYLAITSGHEDIMLAALGVRADSQSSRSWYGYCKTQRWWHIRGVYFLFCSALRS